MTNKTILVTGKDAFTGSVLVDMVEKEQLGHLCPYCSTGPEALDVIDRFQPHMILLDLYLPGMNGISILKEIKERKRAPQILGYCRRLNTRVGVMAVKEGATGLVDYTSSTLEFRDAMTRVSRGVKTYPFGIIELLHNNDYEKYPRNYLDLSTRQSQILELAALGKSNKEISFELNIHIKTVEKYKHIMKEKFGLTSVAEVVHFAIRNGIIEKEEGICS